MKSVLRNIVNKFNNGRIAVVGILAGAILATTVSLAQAGPNLIINPSFEVSSDPASADSWTPSNWGSLTAAYSIKSDTAQDGANYARVDVSNYASGDARWDPAAVDVAANTTYNYTAWYRSNVPTEVDAEVQMSDGSLQYFWMGDAPAASSWSQLNLDFTPPAGAVKATVYQLIDKNGWLETDNVNFNTSTQDPTPTPTPDPSPTPSPTPEPAPQVNLLANPSVESGSGNTAVGWGTSKSGWISAKFTTPSGDAQDGQRSARVDVSWRLFVGDASWKPSATMVEPSTEYNVSNWYKSNVSSEMFATYKLSNGSTKTVSLKKPAASGSWTQNSLQLTTPANAKDVIIYQSINQKGWIQTDNYSIVKVGGNTTPTPTPTPTDGRPFSKPLVSIEFDDGWTTAYNLGLPAVESFGWKSTQNIITDTAINNDEYGNGTYMTPAQIIDWNNRGDVGSHSVTHPSLPSLSLAGMTAEMTNSKNYLDSLLGEPTNLFATPYCESNAQVVALAKSLYQASRNCDDDVMTASDFDRWNLRSFIVLNTTTDAEITAMLNKAKATNGWITFVWHEIAGDNKNDWSVSQSTLKRQLQLIKNSGIDVVLTQTALNISLGS